MSSVERFQNVVLGGGEAGKYIAWELARSGQRVAVVERGLIGGSCPNIACLPSKNVIRSAKVVELVRHAATFGLRLGPWSLDMAGVRQRKREMVNGMIDIHKARFAAYGLEFILGEGHLVAPRTIDVAAKSVTMSSSRLSVPIVLNPASRVLRKVAGASASADGASAPSSATTAGEIWILLTKKADQMIMPVVMTNTV